MNSKRLRLILICLIAAGAALFIAVCILGLSALKVKSKQVVDLKLKSRTVDAQLTNFTEAKTEVEKYSYFKQVAKTVIPSDKDQAQAVLDIFQLASDSGISLQGVTFSASTLGLGSTTTNAQSATTKTVLSQAKPVDGIPGLYSIQLTVTPDTSALVPNNRRATYPKLLDFLSRIEHNRRTAQVSEVTIQPQTSENGSSQFISFNLVINVFIKP